MPTTDLVTSLMVPATSIKMFAGSPMMLKASPITKAKTMRPSVLDAPIKWPSRTTLVAFWGNKTSDHVVIATYKKEGSVWKGPKSNHYHGRIWTANNNLKLLPVCLVLKKQNNIVNTAFYRKIKKHMDMEFKQPYWNKPGSDSLAPCFYRDREKSQTEFKQLIL